MQQHSAQHLLSALFDQELGHQTESFHLGANYSSIDLATNHLSLDHLQEIEDQVNEVIFNNIAIQSYTLMAEQLHTIPIRKKPDLDGKIRIVEIKDLDFSACAGTHVASTGQIGLLKILKAEKYKSMIRVSFLAGQRALHDYRLKHQICLNLGAQLSVPEQELITRIELELDEKQALIKQVTEIKSQLFNLQAESIVAQQVSPYFITLADASIPEAQELAREILKRSEGIVIINLGERLVLSHNLQSSLHLGNLVKEQAQAFGGRGGGNAQSSQIYFAEPEQLNQFILFLRSNFVSLIN